MLNVSRVAQGVKRKVKGEKTMKDDVMLRRAMIGLLLWVIGVGCGYGWHMMAIG